ncbi:MULTISPECIES: nucleotidyltransferase family protein [Odoribacteraceae]|jgi:predicted nucleotidyltransferase|uniref:nucleotidyltransferase family protein n=1 Tax=Culturomica massiliensis TaxID=1841857 RepID=UPI000340EDB5|nr:MULTISPECIES: nucleotidyltransferase family protein [Odoribacteraceae]RHV95285.1 DNA polymerase subunit beta [Odoribacter sp. OF09-27XD]CCZ08978.1 dNA polymerase beta domain protein region [Odoribacter sp. CAG:788]
MKSISEYLQLLAGYMQTHASIYHIRRIGIFGSVARGEQTEHSDIDICYEGEAPTLFTLARIKYELEALLGCPVDLVRVRERMDEVLKQTIQKEAIYV